MTEGTGQHDAADDAFRVAPVFFPTPYTSTIEAFKHALATIADAIADAETASAAIDLRLAQGELAELGERLVTYDTEYRMRGGSVSGS